MPSINDFYVQTLSQPLPPQDTDDPAVYEAKIDRLRNLVDGADAVVLGIGSGVSTAAGYDFYHGSRAFDRRFAAFERAHGFGTLFDGLYHVFGSNEEQWAFDAAVIDFVAGLPVGEPYLDLATAMRDRDYFVLTTNVDGQAERAFGSERTFAFQGDLRYLQCPQPCNDEVTEGTEMARRLVAATEIGPTALPVCRRTSFHAARTAAGSWCHGCATSASSRGGSGASGATATSASSRIISSADTTASSSSSWE